MPAKPKILIFSTAYFPFVGGAEIAVKEVTDRLPEYDFDLITSKLGRGLPRQEKIGNVTVYRMGLGNSFDKIYLAFFGHRLAFHLHKKNPYSASWAIMASFGGLAATNFKRRVPSVPFLLTLQEGDDLAEAERKATILGSWWKSIFTRADGTQCISNYLADWAKRRGAKVPIEVIPNGVEATKFPFGELAGQKKLVTTSRLVSKNGLDLVIKALPLLPPEVTFHIAGVGIEENNLRNLAAELGVLERVLFHGFIIQEDLPDFLKKGDIFIRPSRSEGLGISFLEAMAIGIPVVAPSVGGIVDFLEDKKTGFVVRSEDPQSIAEVVTFVLDISNKDLIESVRRTARTMMEEKYNWDTITFKMRAMFENLSR